MTETAVAGKRSAFAQAITTTYARSRALLAAIVLAAVVAIALLSGLAMSPAPRSASQPAAVGAGAIPQAAAPAHLAWLRGEHDSYGSFTTSPAAAAQAHLTWLRDEHASNGSATWIEYRQFRLSEEGYGQ
jgi:hypothetical protein